MYAVEYDKSNSIIYNNLLFNKYQEIQVDWWSSAIMQATKLWLLRYQILWIK